MRAAPESWSKYTTEVTAQLFGRERGGASDPKNPDLYYSERLASLSCFIYKNKFYLHIKCSKIHFSNGLDHSEPNKMAAILSTIGKSNTIGKQNSWNSELVGFSSPKPNPKMKNFMFHKVTI